MALSSPVPRSHLRLYLLIYAGMLLVITSALAFEHIGGYIPCKLCLQQRIPWYVGVPLVGIAALVLLRNGPPKLIRGLMVIAGITMVVSLYLGVNHAGVEWGWWQGPGDCGAVEGGISSDAGNFLQQLQETVPPSCDEAALRVAGLSFAGWNALMSLVLAIASFWAALRK
ncbi:MAG: disulfide bond formation protein B [Pseudomonadota bacterium]